MSSPTGPRASSNWRGTRPGFTRSVFSDAEMASLKEGTSWLTVTVGNFATTAKQEDPKFPVTMLSRGKDQAQVLNLGGPKYYCGRILFEDGSPAILAQPPWPGAEIWPDFPYAGMGHLDADGYFKIFFTPEQFEKLKSLKPRRNIYIPTAKRGNSTAMEIYPPEMLSQEKAKAGMVKIPNPVFKPR